VTATKETPTPQPANLIAPGHSACLGCGELLAARLVLQAVGPNVIIVQATGCMEVTTTKYPESAWEVPWIHSLFDNIGAVAAGIEMALRAMGKEGSAKVIAQGGDGALADIGFGPLSGMWERGHNVMTVCYDNEAYMNTGVQRSGLTPFAARTSTSPPGKQSFGNWLPKKDMVEIALAHGLPYVATSSPAYPRDLMRKAKKAAEVQGPSYLQLLVPCPLGWGFGSAETINIGKLAIQSGIYPIVEFENGELVGWMRVPSKRPTVEEYLSKQVRFRHLAGEKAKDQVARIQAIADANIARFKLDQPPPRPAKAAGTQ